LHLLLFMVPTTAKIVIFLHLLLCYDSYDSKKEWSSCIYSSFMIYYITAPFYECVHSNKYPVSRSCEFLYAETYCTVVSSKLYISNLTKLYIYILSFITNAWHINILRKWKFRRQNFAIFD
jgi:hypothetical protein